MNLSVGASEPFLDERRRLWADPLESHEVAPQSVDGIGWGGRR